MAGKPDTWRLIYFSNRDDLTPSRVELIEAHDEGEAADLAGRNMRDDMRVDVVRTVVRNSN